MGTFLQFFLVQPPTENTLQAHTPKTRSAGLHRPPQTAFSPCCVGVLFPLTCVCAAPRASACACVRFQGKQQFVLYSSASGYGLFEVVEALEGAGALHGEAIAAIDDLSRFGKMVKLVGFSAFTSAEDALANINSISECTLGWLSCRGGFCCVRVRVGVGLAC